MTNIQKYRLDSSEWMGFETEIIKGKRYYTKDKIKIRIQAWQPDISYSQMHMMIQKLIEEGAPVSMTWVYDKWIVSVAYSLIEHENIRTAFRLACTNFKIVK